MTKFLICGMLGYRPGTSVGAVAHGALDALVLISLEKMGL